MGKDLLAGWINMTVKYKIPFLLQGLLLLILASCSTAFTRMDRLVETNDLVLYSLPEESYPGDEELLRELPPVEHFPELSEDAYRALLGNLVYEKSIIWGNTRRRVFYEEEMDRMIPILQRAVRNLPPGNRLVVISRFDPDRSVLSRMERVSFVLWKDIYGINLVFGDLREEIPHNDPLAEDDWRSIHPISFSDAPYGVRLLPPDQGSLKIILNREHRSWVVFPAEVLPGLVYRPQTDQEEEKENSSTPAVTGEDPQVDGANPDEEESKGNRSEKLLQELRDLKQAKEEGLISPEEYEAMREETVHRYRSSGPGTR